MPIRRRGAILLIEDNPQDEELTLRALEQHQITSDIFVTRDGKEALDYIFAQGLYGARDPHELPTLVLLDLKLPKIDGIEVLRRLRAHERTKLLPVVILTSSVEDRDRLAGYGNGANSFVRKPVDYIEFSEAVRQLGLYWLVVNEPPPATGVPQSS